MASDYFNYVHPLEESKNCRSSGEQVPLRMTVRTHGTKSVEGDNARTQLCLPVVILDLDNSFYQK